MYARTLAVEFHPGTRDRVQHLYQNRILPALRRQPGFQRLLLLANEHNDILSIILWDTLEGLTTVEMTPTFYQFDEQWGPLAATSPAPGFWQVTEQATNPPQQVFAFEEIQHPRWSTTAPQANGTLTLHENQAAIATSGETVWDHFQRGHYWILIQG